MAEVKSDYDDGGLRRLKTIYDQSKRWDDDEIAVCMASGSPEALDDIVRMVICHLNKLAARVMSEWSNGPYKRQRIDDLVDAALGDLGQRLGQLVQAKTSPKHLLNAILKRARAEMHKELTEQSGTVRVPQSTMRRRLRAGKTSPVRQQPLPDDYEAPNRYGDVQAEVTASKYWDSVDVLVDAAKDKAGDILPAVELILDGGSLTAARRLAVSCLPWGKGLKAGNTALRELGEMIENDASLDRAREVVFWCWGANRDELDA